MKVVRILTYKSCHQVLRSSIRYKISSFLDNFVHFFLLDNFVHFFIGFGHFLQVWTILSNFFRSWSFISIHFFSFLDNFVHFFFYFWTILSTFLSGLVTFLWDNFNNSTILKILTCRN